MAQMKVLTESDEKLIIEMYKTNSVESIARNFKISNERIKLVLEKHGVPLKTPRKKTANGKKFDLDGAVHARFEIHDGMQMFAVSKFDGTKFKDYLNVSGALTMHLRKHGITAVPTLYEKAKLIQETGKLWYEEWFDFVEEPIEEHGLQCPYCSYHTVGDLRRPGFFIKHLWDVHHVSEEQFISEHPEYKDRFTFANKQIELQRSTDKDEYVVCAICGKKFRRLCTKHLLTVHGITREDYVNTYLGGTGSTLSNYTLNKLRDVAKKANENMEFISASKMQVEIEDYIKSLGFEVLRNDRKTLHGIEIDAFVPSLNFGVEYNGNFWHNDLHNAKNKPNIHKDKMDVASKNDINLLMAFEDEYVYHKELVQAKIRQGLGLNEEKSVDGCIVSEISNEEAKEFLDKECITGYSNSTMNYGAYLQNKLIAVMSFRKTSQRWQLVRYCGVCQDESVSIASLLFDAFVRENDPKSVEFLADRRWIADTDKIFCLSLGFKFARYTKPEYTYYNPSHDRYERVNKHFTNKQRLLNQFPNLFNDSMTMEEMLRSLGWSRIYDAGYACYMYENNGCRNETPLQAFIRKATEKHAGENLDYSKVVYINNKIPVCIIDHDKKPDGTEYGEYWQRPDNHLMGKGHPKKASAKIRKSKATRLGDFIKMAKEAHPNENLDYSKVDYINNHTPVCIIDNDLDESGNPYGEYWQLPSNHLRGASHPRKKSNKIILTKIKNGTGKRREKKINVNSLTIRKGNNREQVTLSQTDQQNIKELLKYVKELVHGEEIVVDEDFGIMVPSMSISFKYVPLIGNKRWELLDIKKCGKEKGISVINIFADEFDRSKFIVEEKIKHFLGFSKGKTVIGGRKCEIVPISKDDAEMFLDMNHIQGFANGSVYLGAVYDNELVAVSVYKKETETMWNLSRFATDIDYACPGIASKMFKYFIEKYDPIEIKSFLDRRWCLKEEDNLYTKLGFSFDGYVEPDYRYIDGNVHATTRHHKFGFRKQILCKKYPDKVDMSMTETEMTEKLGWHKIYDCGLIRYVWRKKDEPIAE